MPHEAALEAVSDVGSVRALCGNCLGQCESLRNLLQTHAIAVDYCSPARAVGPHSWPREHDHPSRMFMSSDSIVTHRYIATVAMMLTIQKLQTMR